MSGQSKDTHVLRELELPARYEALADRVGPEIAQLLVDPGQVTKSTLERAGLSVRGRREGALFPLFAGSGTGKTTLANNLSAFLPSEYAATIVHEGAVDFDSARRGRLGSAARGERLSWRGCRLSSCRMLRRRRTAVMTAVRREELDRVFFLDDADRELIDRRRGDHSRLGFALQLTTARWLGAFLPDPTAVPVAVLRYVAGQLEVEDPSVVRRYLERRRTRFEHAEEIKAFEGLRDFAAVSGGLEEWAAARAYMTGDGPRAIFTDAVGWLRDRDVLLPVRCRLGYGGRDKAGDFKPALEPMFSSTRSMLAASVKA